MSTLSSQTQKDGAHTRLLYILLYNRRRQTLYFALITRWFFIRLVITVCISYPARPDEMALRAIAHSSRLRSRAHPTVWGTAMSPFTSRLEALHPPLQ